MNWHKKGWLGIGLTFLAFVAIGFCLFMFGCESKKPIVRVMPVEQLPPGPDQEISLCDRWVIYVLLNNGPSPYTTAQWAHEVCDRVETWCDRLDFHYPEAVLATLFVESNLNPKARGIGGEKGMGQVTAYSAKRFGRKLNLLGYAGKVSSADWQVALCVEELKARMDAGVSLDLALKQYNGRGKRAARHLERVKEVMRSIR